MLYGLAAPAVATAAVEHVLVIGCDGLGAVGITGTNTPVLHQLMRQGAWTLRARAVMPTSSSPNWASMIMGAGPEQHGVTSNDWQTNKFEIAPLVTGQGGMFPTIFGMLREQRPRSIIACVYDWDGFGRLLESRAPDILENVPNAVATVRRAREVIIGRRPTFTFVHLDSVDHAGHASGWKSPEYFLAVEQADRLVGDLLAALSEADIREKTVVLVTADHGGKGKSHGGLSMDELEIPWILTGPGVRQGHAITSEVNIYDTAATLAKIFKLTPPAAWIGRPVTEAFGR